MKRLILLAASLLLTSCFDVREEITVAADVSGHLRFDYTVPKEALLVIGGKQGIGEQIDEILADEPRVRVETLEVTTEGRETHLHIGIIADSMLAPMDLQKTEAFQHLPASSRRHAARHSPDCSATLSHPEPEKTAMNDKIEQHHRDRAAYIYVRQSTGHQVRHNHQGRQRQYDLAARAGNAASRASW